MKHIKWWGWMVASAIPLLAAEAKGQTASEDASATQAQPAASANLSAPAAEVIRLAGGGVGDDVVLAYIQNSQAAFSLSASAGSR